MTLCTSEPESPVVPAALDLPEGVPPLRSFYLYLSNSCNLACRHCWITPRFVDGRPDPGDVIDVAALCGAVREAKPLGLLRAKLTGGEPLLHPRFRELVDALTTEGLALSMETNGTLMTADLARHLKRETNVTFISVSLDGADAETHDAFRGVPGAFDVALRGLDNLVAAGYTNCQVIMSVHRGNRDQVAAVAELAIVHGAGSVKLNPVTNSGRGAAMHEHGEGLGFDAQMALDRWLREDLRPRLRDQGAELDLILNLPLALMPIGEIVRRKGNSGACGVRSILGILGTGEIALCGIGRTVPDLVYGRLGEDSIRDIWFHHPAILELRRLLDAPEHFPGICGECTMARRCRTGCVAQNFVGSGRLTWPDALCAEAAARGIFPETRRRPQATIGV
jgi:SynChlorMet cassette radical SAM/SPASM protein ScmF